MDSPFMKFFAFNSGSMEYTSSSMGFPESSKSLVGSLTIIHGAINSLVLCCIAKGVAAMFGSGGVVSSKTSTSMMIIKGAAPE
jgi:hypothetical protein